MKVTAE